jgi:hypothetical protein
MCGFVAGAGDGKEKRRVEYRNEGQMTICLSYFISSPVFFIFS